MGVRPVGFFLHFFRQVHSSRRRTAGARRGSPYFPTQNRLNTRSRRSSV